MEEAAVLVVAVEVPVVDHLVVAVRAEVLEVLLATPHPHFGHPQVSAGVSVVEVVAQVVISVRQRQRTTTAQRTPSQNQIQNQIQYHNQPRRQRQH